MNTENEEINFFEVWDIYQKIIKNNYMYHSKIINIIKNEIAHIKTLSILDLGCGDSYMVKNTVAINQLRYYLGIDTSVSALRLSKTNLVQHKGDIEHINGDLLAELENLSLKHDLIISGYALHHLNTKEKETFFSLVQTLLSNNGVFIIYDIESNGDETTDEYNNRACTILKNNWNQMTDAEIKSITKHVQENDLPETERFYLKNLADNGLGNIEKAFRDKDCLFSLYISRKQSFK